MITRSNYEEFFVDYFDGKLDKILQEELFSFLRMNPDLEEEFNHYSGVKTVPDLKINYTGKEKLKKNIITEYNYKTWLVGYIENDLKIEQKKEVDNYLLKNPTLKPELEILKLSHLIPDKRIVFTKKNTLKKGGKIIIFTPAVKRTLAIAATLILVTITYFIIQQLNSPKSVVSDQREKKQNKVDNYKNYELVQNQPDTKKIKTPKNVIQNNKTVILKGKSEKNLEQLQANKEKEMNVPVIPDTLNPIQLTENLHQFAEQNNIDTINNKELASTQKTENFITNQMAPVTRSLSDIFSEEDLKDLGIDLNNGQGKTKPKNNTLLDLASNELKKISKSTDISVEKHKDLLNNSVTYALGIGKKFSISHTSVQ